MSISAIRRLRHQRNEVKDMESKESGNGLVVVAIIFAVIALGILVFLGGGDPAQGWAVLQPMLP